MKTKVSMKQWASWAPSTHVHAWLWLGYDAYYSSRYAAIYSEPTD